MCLASAILLAIGRAIAAAVAVTVVAVTAVALAAVALAVALATAALIAVTLAAVTAMALAAMAAASPAGQARTTRSNAILETFDFELLHANSKEKGLAKSVRST